jgi:hypothetical protein
MSSSDESSDTRYSSDLTDQLYREVAKLDKANTRIKKQLQSFSLLDKTERKDTRELL